jgi:hypothetical protein
MVRVRFVLIVAMVTVTVVHQVLMAVGHVRWVDSVTGRVMLVVRIGKESDCVRVVRRLRYVVTSGSSLVEGGGVRMNRSRARGAALALCGNR